MSIQGLTGHAGSGRVKRALGVQAVLEWAFRVEKAQLELPPPKDVVKEGFGFGLEYVLLQRAALGCKVDGGHHKIGSYPCGCRRSGCGTNRSVAMGGNRPDAGAAWNMQSSAKAAILRDDGWEKELASFCKEWRRVPKQEAH